MCLRYIYNLCFKTEDYEDIPSFDQENVFDKCMNILIIYEPGLIVRYNKETGFITFSKDWSTWFNTISISLKNFIQPYNQVEVSNEIMQLIYFCKIPIKYHRTFLSLLEAEYEM